MSSTRTIVFIHGVPETAAIWRPLMAELRQRELGRVVALSPPGFGVPVPSGFEPSMGAYLDWLVSELEAIDGEIDVVGHDWGAGHLYGLLAAHPEMVRTWAADVIGLIHRDYAWHDMAQAWQTPEVGEQVIDGITGGSIDERTALLASLGLADDIALELAIALNDEMGRCILALYRDAAQPTVGDLGDRLAATALPPGLAINATADAYVPPDQTLEMAARVGVDVLTLEGRGHWWMTDGVGEVADALVEFWAAN